MNYVGEMEVSRLVEMIVSVVLTIGYVLNDK